MTRQQPKRLAQALLWSLLGLLAIGAAEVSKKELKALQEALPAKYQQWLDEVAVLISKEERVAFLQIDKDYQRDAFIDRFWIVRDAYDDTTRNEFKDLYMRRVEEARQRFGGLTVDRARILLLRGAPDALIPIRCVNLWPAEVWYYQSLESWSGEAAILFLQQWGSGPYRLWHAADGMNALLRFAQGTGGEFRLSDAGCVQEQQQALKAVLGAAAQLGRLGYSSLIQAVEAKPDTPSKEWVATFASYTTEVAADAQSFEANLEIDYPGRRQSRTMLQGILSVTVDQAEISQLGSHRSFNFVLTGEVLHDGRLFDRFRYKYNLPAKDQGEILPLVFERYLRPGDYTIYLKLEDQNAESFYRTQKPVSVPKVEFVAPNPPADSETARILAEANRAISTGDNTIQIIPPYGELHSGLMRFDTLTTGPDIDEVSFSFDGSQVLKKKRPPFSVELDLGSLPRRRLVTAIAYDRVGNEVARDDLLLNAGSHRFDIRLVEPRRGGKYAESLRARAEVEVPEGELVERVEFYVNETLMATLYQPPYVQPLVLPQSELAAYVRAVAYEADGNFTEDTVFINGPEFSDQVKVNLVELYVLALDRNKRPVHDLELPDFSIAEDAVPQQPHRFDRVTNLPIHAGVLLDVSASMEENLQLAQQAALQFFQDSISPRDRATLITFNDHPNLSVPFTNQLDKLAGGLAGIKAERGTALYDSVIFALYYFNGVRGQRALILLSDGKDESSRFAFENMLEFAQRAGVSIYSIGLNLPRREGDARKRLSRVARETGGRSFFIKEGSELSAVYEEILAELRARYYLVYQSQNSKDDDRFRSIQVKVDRAGVEAKTKSGYYP